MPEYESDNRGAMSVEGEIHHGEAVEEKISLSGPLRAVGGASTRSARTLYVDVVRRWVEKLAGRSARRSTGRREAEAAAILWSQRKGDRSGRIAYQFACDWVGRTVMERRRG